MIAANANGPSGKLSKPWKWQPSFRLTRGSPHGLGEDDVHKQWTGALTEAANAQLTDSYADDKLECETPEKQGPKYFQRAIETWNG